MLSKIISSLLILAPLGLIYAIAAMSFEYKGPLTAVYIAVALTIAGFCLWSVTRILHGTLASWSFVTWIFLAIDLGLLVLTTIPLPGRK
jgi:hypothetical protein